MKRTGLKRSAAMVLLAGSLAMQTPALAAPVLSNTAALKAAASSDLVEVRWRGRGGAVAAGVAAGLLLGAIAGASSAYYGPPPYYYGPGYYAPPYGPVYAAPAPVYGPEDWVAYCFSRYRSFDPVSGTYMGYDGRRHYCQ